MPGRCGAVKRKYLRLPGSREGNRVYSKPVEKGKALKYPLTDEEQGRRFRDCVAFATKPFPGDKVENIITSVDHLERMDDIRGLVPLLLLE